jgi:hypothetical protein
MGLSEIPFSKIQVLHLLRLKTVIVAAMIQHGWKCAVALFGSTFCLGSGLNVLYEILWHFRIFHSMCNFGLQTGFPFANLPMI